MLSKYTIDPNNVIVEIDEGFQQFGQENGGELFDPLSWVGHNVLRVVQGDSTRMYYQVLFKRVRMTSKVVELPYRCDSPTEARFMQMHVSCDKEQNIYFVNRTEAIIPFDRPIVFNFNGKEPINRCSICNRLEIGTVWTDPLDVRKLPLDFDLTWKVSYVLCPLCRDQMHSFYKT